MLEILHFIFSDAWVFLGTAVLIGITCDGLATIVRAFHGRKRD